MTIAPPPTAPISTAPSRLDADELRRLEAAIFSITRGVMHGAHQFDSGLDKAGYVTLVNLARCGAVRQTGLAARMGLDLSTVSRQVRQLEALGLVARTDDPDDGRAQVIALTAAGKREITKQRQGRWAPVADRLSLVPEHDRGRFLDFLEQLAEHAATAEATKTCKTGRTPR
jgi:DNA-binding MarR family transcriptional regulator